MNLKETNLHNQLKSVSLSKLKKLFDNAKLLQHNDEAINYCLAITNQLIGKRDFVSARPYVEFLDLKKDVFDDESLKGDYYKLLADYFIYIRSNKKALQCLSKLVKIYSDKKEHLKLSETYNSIGIVKDYLLDYKNALEFFENAYDISASDGTGKYRATLLRNQGLMHLKLGYPDKAYEIYMLALKCIEHEEKNERFKAILYGNIAEVFLKNGDAETAIVNYEKGKTFFETYNSTDSKFYPQLLLELGSVYGETGKKERELECYLTAKTYFDKLDFPQLSKDVYYKLYIFYEEEGDTSLALKYFKLFHELELQKVKDDFHQESEANNYEIELKQKTNFIEFQRELIVVKNKANKDLNEEISLRKQREKELEEVNKELDHFISVASHDLKEPLRTISNYSSLLKRRINEENEKELLGFIEDGASRMYNLLNDLLQYSRSGNKTIEHEVVDLNILFGVVKTNLEAQIKASNAIIECNELPSLVGQQFLYLQIIQNLMTNAIKYQPKGQQPHLIVNAKVFDNKHVISFKDNGIGIDGKDLKTIFEPFKRLQNRADYEGSGIGLATVKRLVERLNGEISVVSEVGKGSSFTLIFPLAT